MLLLVLCLVLVQGTLQHPQNEEVQSHHGGLTPAEYQTSFSCETRVAGYYADIESGCQLYHLCDVDGRRFTHSCPNATLFQQRMMICDHWYMVNCNKSVHDYNANLLIGQRDKPFIGSDHIHHREPVKFFTASHNPGSLQHPNWFPTIGNRPGRVPEDDNSVPSPSQQVSSIHFTYTPPPSSSNVDSSSSSQRDTSYRDFFPDNVYSKQPLPQTSRSRSQEQKIETSSSNSRPIQHERELSSFHREARYRDFNAENINSGQYIPQTSTSRSEEQTFVTPSYNIAHHNQRVSGSLQREARHRDINGDDVNSGLYVSETSTSRSKEERVVATPSSSNAHRHETISRASQREVKNRNININENSARLLTTRTFTTGIEDQRVVNNNPEFSFSLYHETESERKLPDAYTNNPFFQHLINRVTPPTVIKKPEINPRQNAPKILQQNESKTINQQPAKLEDIANIRISNFQIPSTPGRVERVSIRLNNDGAPNVSPNARDRKFPDSYLNNPFIQSAANTKPQEVPAVTTPRIYVPNTTDKKFIIRENEEDLNNIVELHILDPRKMFFIPESKSHEIRERNSTVLFISVPTPLHNNSHGFMNFRNNIKSLEGTNPQCPRCHPAFLSPGKCHPCVIIR